MWKNVIGFEDSYILSDKGEIFSKDRMCTDAIGRKRFRKGVKINPDIAPNGYYRVTLSKNGSKKQVYLHRLLANHFIPNPNNLPQVNHKDGNKLNCNLDNLEWVTNQENVIHAYKNGLIRHVCGEKHPNGEKRNHPTQAFGNYIGRSYGLFYPRQRKIARCVHQCR